MGKKMFLSWAVVCIIISVAVGYLSAAYPYAKNIRVVPVAIQGNTVTLKGSVDIYFTDRAWKEFGYKNGNFHNFDKYWQSQEAKKFSYLGNQVRIEHIDWTLVKHYHDHDRLSFVIKLKVF